MKIEIEVDTLEQLARSAGRRRGRGVAGQYGACDAARSGRNGRRAAPSPKPRAGSPGNRAGNRRDGVDLLSAGWLTHSAKILDIGLDFVSSVSAGLRRKKQKSVTLVT